MVLTEHYDLTAELGRAFASRPTLLDAPQREAFPDANVRSPYEPDGEFHVVENVPIFAEHQTKARDGRLLDFNYVNLKKLCDNCNRRIKSRGNYATIVIGHSPDPALVRAGQAHSPPAVGFAGPFRMGLLGFGDDQVWAILARLRFFLDAWELARKYPTRSPELWLMPSYEEMFLDPICLLGAETPRLDMGLLYSAMLHVDGRSPVMVEKYSAAAAPAAGNVFVPSHVSAHRKRTENYQGESAMSGVDEIVQGVVTALDSLDWVQWTKQKMQQEQAPAAMGSAPAPDVTTPPAAAPEAALPGTPDGAGEGQPAGAPPTAAAPEVPAVPPATQPTAPAGTPPAAPATPPAGAGTPAGIPAPPAADPAPEAADKPAEKPAEKPEEKDEKEHYSLDALGKAIKEISGQIGALGTELNSERQARKSLERRAKLSDLRDQGYPINPAELFETMHYDRMSDAEFEGQMKLITSTVAAAPLNVMAPTFDGVEMYCRDRPGGGSERDGVSQAQRDRAFQIAEQKALAGEPADYGQILADVKAGKS